MSGKTGIEWTDVTWNPLTGCAHVSPGCDRCYAAREAAGRLSHHPAYEGLAVRPEGEPARFTGEIRLHPDRLDQPLRWRKPRRVFVNSMSDLFSREIVEQHGTDGVAFVAEVFVVMSIASDHQFQVLTKRPQRMAQILTDPAFWMHVNRRRMERGFPVLPGGMSDGMLIPNVWLGTSIESDRYAFRADHLRRTPAAVRFISAEPLLGPLPSLDLTGIDWLIVGGESGPQARPMHPDWVRDLRNRCHPPAEDGCRHSIERLGDEAAAAGDLPDGVTVELAQRPAFFFKQWGEWRSGGWHGRRVEPVDVGDGRSTIMSRVGKKTAGRQLDGRTWDEMPS
ncbi:MAG: phage Gp37/Gp68 family protein [Actinomycetota bacterium]